MKLNIKILIKYLVQPESLIYDPKTRNVYFLGVIDDFKNGIDTNRFEIIKNDNGQVELVKLTWQ